MSHYKRFLDLFFGSNKDLWIIIYDIEWITFSFLSIIILYLGETLIQKFYKI